MRDIVVRTGVGLGFGAALVGAIALFGVVFVVAAFIFLLLAGAWSLGDTLLALSREARLKAKGWSGRE